MMARPSGLVDDLDRSRYAFTHIDYANVLAGFTHTHRTLCRDCDRIDFARHLDYFTSFHTSEISLNAALKRSTECMFCGAIATAASKRPALLDATKQRRINCIVHSRDANPRQNMKDQFPLLLLCVSVKSEQNWRHESWLADYAGSGPVNTDLEYHPYDPLLIFEAVDDAAFRVSTLLRERPTEKRRSDSGTEDSDSDFENSYRRKMTSAWECVIVRKKIGAQIDFPDLISDLNRREASDRGRLGPVDTSKSQLNSSPTLTRLLNSSRFRLVDVNTGDVHILREQVRYFALSYVCGNPPPDTALAIQAGQGDGVVAWSLKWQLLLRTIQDARTVIQQLHEQYLWIDSLCIDQNDAEDRRTIISQMASIYGCAYLTIVAASGDDAHFGLPGVASGSRSPDIVFDFSDSSRKICLLPKRPNFDALIQKSTWATRGWTYQEHLLSRRTLFITEVEAFLTMAGNYTCESQAAYRYQRSGEEPKLSLVGFVSNSGNSKLYASLQKDKPLSWSHFGDAVVTYSQRTLTKSADRLAAFLGLMDRFGRSNSAPALLTTLNGLPMQWFYASLMWTSHGHQSVRHSKPVRIQFDELQSRALPSWSWVGWTGQVEIHEQRLSPRTQNITVEVMNKTNIKCDSLVLGELQPWPFKPRPSEIAETDGIVLHLWTMKVELYVVLYRPGGDSSIDGWSVNGWSICKLIHRDQDNLRDIQMGRIFLKNSLVAEVCNDRKHQFVVLDHLVLLVIPRGDYFERMALGSLSLSFGVKAGESNRQHFDRAGKLTHVKLI